MKYHLNIPGNKDAGNVAIHQIYNHKVIYHRAEKLCNSRDGVSCTILYHSVVEAFFNDVVGFYNLAKEHPARYRKIDGHIGWLYLPTDGIESVVKEALEQIERKNICEKIYRLIKLKHIDEISAKACFKKIKSTHWFQQLKNLTDCRNALVHPKANPLIYNKDTGEITGVLSFLKNHINQGKIDNPDFFDSWINALDTEQYCKWCKETVYSAIKEIKALLPEKELTEYFLYDTKLEVL
ncbi:hypothetical protein AB7092_08570 [Providencia rettgeri]|uniref:hypothetical protein n=1 Tax=Providencia rettgeri TaxID=587 RepID=UPI0024AB7494